MLTTEVATLICKDNLLNGRLHDLHPGSPLFNPMFPGRSGEIPYLKVVQISGRQMRLY